MQRLSSSLDGRDIDSTELWHFETRKILLILLLEHENGNEPGVDTDDVLPWQARILHQFRQILVKERLEVHSSNVLD